MISIVTNLVGNAIKRGTRPYSTRAFPIKKPYQKNVEQETGGVYKPGHMLAVDPNISPDKGVVKGELTSGPGSPSNPSYPISNVKGFNSTQRFIPATEPMEVPKHVLGPEIKGSEAYFKQEDVARNMKIATELARKKREQEEKRIAKEQEHKTPPKKGGHENKDYKPGKDDPN